MVSRPQVMVPSPSRDTRSPLDPTCRRFHGGDPNGRPSSPRARPVTVSACVSDSTSAISSDPTTRVDQLRLTQHAEALGFDVVWAAEAYGSDSPTVLAWLAAQTSTIDVGSAVMQIPARTPAMTAMTAASLDVLTGGRFRLGLGVSGPQVSEGWHGVRFDTPLASYPGVRRRSSARRCSRSTVTFRRRALPAPAARRARQGAQADHRTDQRTHSDLPGRRRTEEPRAGR